MNAIERLSQALLQEKEFRPPERLPVSDLPSAAQPAFDFIAIRPYWGSITSIALVKGDSLSETQIKDYCDYFWSITATLSRYAGTLQISTAFKTAAVKLGSYGILCFVFEGGCGADLISFIQRQKRFRFASKEYSLFWVVDVPAGRVFTHRWLPLGVFPGRKYLEDVLAGRAGPGAVSRAA
jgi:hypothetical protein